MASLDSGTTFLSYSSADQAVAARLREELKRLGVSTWLDEGSISAGADWRHKIEEAIHSAGAILVLVGPGGEPDDLQRFTWRAALETVWEDSEKRIVPVLLGDAKVPTFIYSADVPFETVRIDDPQNLQPAARAVAGTLSRLRKTTDERLKPRNGGDTGSTKSGLSRSAIPPDIEAERTARLSEVRRYAELLKASR